MCGGSCTRWIRGWRWPMGGTAGTSPAGATGQRRFILAMILLFAGTATLLAIVGAYGVLTWSVRQRSRARGIRVAAGAAGGRGAGRGGGAGGPRVRGALGGARRWVLGLVVRQGIWFGITVMIGGLLMALASTRVLQTLL